MESQTKQSIFKQTLTALFLLLFAFSGGCTLSGIDEELTNNTISEDDLQAASQILGESLSSDNSGLVLSLNDAITTVSKDGFTTSSKQKTSPETVQDESGRGSESNFSYSYDPETGIHTISFLRIVERPLFTKEVTDTLKYIFTDNNGSFIEFPRQEKERIETIDYKAHRQGMVETPSKNSSFNRKDTLLINGVSQASPVLQIDGVHNGSGSLELERPDGDFLKRFYRLTIEFLNIEIEKALVKDGLEQGVTGTLTWQMNIQKNKNGEESTKIIRGTVEMNGDGTALLRFKDHLKIFQVNLDDGDVKDREREFEGQVTSVSPDRHFFTLRSGHQIFVNRNTEYDNDEYPSLQRIQEAIHNGVKVWAEGEGFKRDGRFIATEVDFERWEKDDDSDPQRHEFEEYVTSVNPDQQTFTLGENVILKIDQTAEESPIDDSGDYTSLEAVQQALDQGIHVLAKGKAKTTGDNAHADLLVIEVRFDNESESDDSTDSEKD